MRRLAQQGIAGGLLIFGLAAVALAVEESKDEADLLGIATLLVRDGHFDRARLVLEKMQPEQIQQDESRYQLLRGLVALHQEQYRKARRHLILARQLGNTEPLLALFLAQAFFGCEDWQAVLSELEQAPPAIGELAGTHLLLAQSNWRMKRHEQASQWLLLGQKRFPQNLEFLRLRFLLLLDLGLYQTAREEGQHYLELVGYRLEDVLMVTDALIKARQPQQAILLLEHLRLVRPEKEALSVQLAKAYAVAERTIAAALVVRELALENPRHGQDAAELFRQAGLFRPALWMNSLVQDARARTRQRLSLLVDQGRFEEAVALVPALERLGLFREDEISYALAFAYFKNGQHQEARKRLRGISDRQVFERAVELQRVMEICQQRGWECN